MNTEEKLAVIAAYDAGKAVLFQKKKSLSPVPYAVRVKADNTWDFENFDYWVKPEPREWYIYACDADKKEATAFNGISETTAQVPLIKVREVIEE